MNETTVNLRPITHQYDLRCSAEQAFDTYVRRIGEWWDPAYTADPETFDAVTIEPRVGGRVYATHRDGVVYDWGEVREIRPPERFVYTSTLAQTGQAPSEIAVTFVPTDGGCSVRFEHGGWNPGNASSRAKFGDWPVILGRFVALAETA